MNWSAIAAVFLALAVALGAFGAHGLKARLDANHLDIYKTAVLYHFLHALGMLIVSTLPRTGTFSADAANSVCWQSREWACWAPSHPSAGWRLFWRGCCWPGN